MLAARGPSRHLPHVLGRTRWRRGVAGLTAVAIPILLAGCTLPAPAGNAPLRYRDAVFGNVTVQDNITYGQAPDATGTVTPQMLDSYTPSGDTQTSRPAIVLVHGGGFRGGDRQDYGVTLLANAFAQRGYVAVSINYPLLVTNEVCSKEAVPSQTCVNAAFAAQHAAQAAIPVPTGERVSRRHRPEPDRRRGDIGRRGDGARRGGQLRRPGHGRQPRILVLRERGDGDLRRAAGLREVILPTPRTRRC